MVSKIRIKNFKSLKDVTLNLQRVNLFIGPNNSGKTNFLQALEFFGKCYKGKFTDKEEFAKLSFRRGEKNTDNNKYLALIFDNVEEYDQLYFQLGWDKQNTKHPNYKIALFNIKLNDFRFFEERIIFNIKTLENTIRYKPYIFISYPIFEDIAFINHLDPPNDYNNESDGLIFENMKNIFYKAPKFPESYIFYERKIELDFFENLRIYKPDINKLKIPCNIRFSDNHVLAYASNLVAFLDNIRDKFPEIIENINRDLNHCIPEFKGIRFDKVEKHGDTNTYKKIGLINKSDEIFWAEELSDGTLYFLALLAIIHQPSPPKLLLLEEPELYIHPRRLRELIDLFFWLADNKDIQIILTTHSPILLNQFKENTEGVHVFTMINGETKIENLRYDIIEKMKSDGEMENSEDEDLLDSLGNAWVTGFFGGVNNE